MSVQLLSSVSDEEEVVSSALPRRCRRGRALCAALAAAALAGGLAAGLRRPTAPGRPGSSIGMAAAPEQTLKPHLNKNNASDSSNVSDAEATSLIWLFEASSISGQTWASSSGDVLLKSRDALSVAHGHAQLGDGQAFSCVDSDGDGLTWMDLLKMFMDRLKPDLPGGFFTVVSKLRIHSGAMRKRVADGGKDIETFHGLGLKTVVEDGHIFFEAHPVEKAKECWKQPMEGRAHNLSWWRGHGCDADAIMDKWIEFRCGWDGGDKVSFAIDGVECPAPVGFWERSPGGLLYDLDDLAEFTIGGGGPYRSHDVDIAYVKICFPAC